MNPQSPPPARGGYAILRGTVWQTAAQVAPLVVNLTLTPFVLSSLGRTAFGLWLVTSTFTQFVGQVDGGIGATALRYFTRFAGSGDRASAGRYARTLSLLVCAVIGVVLVPTFLLTDVVVAFFHAPPEFHDGAAFLLRTLVVLLGVGFLRNILAGVLNAHQKFALTSITLLAGYVAYAAGLVIVLNLGWGLHGMAYAFIAQQVVGTLFIVPPALRLIDIRGVGFLTWPQIKEVLGMAWKIQLAGIMNMLSFQGVLLIVGRMAPTQVPDFGPGANFARQLRLLPTNAIAPIQSTLGATIGREGETTAAEQFRRLQQVWVLLVVGWVSVGAPAAYHGVGVWLDLDGNLASIVAGALLIGHLFSLVTLVLTRWLILQGRPEFEMVSSTVTVALTIVLSLATVSTLGALGVVAGTVAAQLIGMVVLLVGAARAEVLPRNPLRDVPWVQACVGAVATWFICAFAADIVRDGLVPTGALGLLLVGLSATPALALYLVTTIGPRRTLRIIKTRSLH